MSLKRLALLLALSSAAIASVPRNPHAVALFKRALPCPATELTTGPCTGFVVDHIRPLCSGGPDSPLNMQWQARPDSLVKDRYERQTCRKSRLKK